MALSDRVVLMHKGRILQTGAPETVYRRPATTEVASFFGTPNLMQAAVTACRPIGGGDFSLAVEGVNGRGECRAGHSFAPGETVTVMVRPEDVTLASPGIVAIGGQFVWPGRVADVVFRGSRRSLTVETTGMRFHVECPATRAASVGDTITLVVEAENAWAIQLPRANGLSAPSQ